MKRTRLFQIAFACIAVVAMLAGSVATSTANDSHIEKVVASFLKHVASLDSVADKQKSEIKNAVVEVGQESPDAVTEGLIQLYPKYSKAVESSDTESIEAAVELLSPLADSNDKFLAADASFYLARTLMNDERFEDAMPRLEQLVGDLSEFAAHQGSAQYFIGVAQAGLLKNDDAVQSFLQFLRFNPDAPERLRVSAWRQVQQIQSIQEGKLDDVYQRMDFSRRRLELIETDEITQTEQDKIVNMLTKLIKEEEKKECSSNCKKGGT
jgi:tetratricopeptide (TPR) repeat protein